MSTPNIGFYEEISKIITYHQISSNTHLISSPGIAEVYRNTVYILINASGVLQFIWLKIIFLTQQYVQILHTKMYHFLVSLCYPFPITKTSP